MDSDISDASTQQAGKGPILDVQGLGLQFGAIKAIDDVSFSCERGQISSVIGPNGAGKTSFFNCLSRVYFPQRGTIHYEGRDISALRSDQIAGIGIVRTFQNLALFEDMNVRDNILTGYHSRGRVGFVEAALNLASARRREAEAQDRADEVIELLGMSGIAFSQVGDLSLGTRKQVELARALMSRPKLLLLDEPAAGLNHTEVGELGDLILRLRSETGGAVLLVEHHMHLVMSISDKIVVLNFGRKLAEGNALTIRENPDVIRAYLGGA